MKSGKETPPIKAVAFEGVIENGTIILPPHAGAQMPRHSPVQVIVLYLDSDEVQEEADWRRLGYETFLREDSSEDSVYDRLYGQV